MPAAAGQGEAGDRRGKGTWALGMSLKARHTRLSVLRQHPGPFCPACGEALTRVQEGKGPGGALGSLIPFLAVHWAACCCRTHPCLAELLAWGGGACKVGEGEVLAESASPGSSLEVVGTHWGAP